MKPLEVRMAAGLARARRTCAASADHDGPKPPTRAMVSAERRARRLALAYVIERAIDDGRLRDYAEAARVLGVSRARITQVMNLLLQPVAVQERILLGDAATRAAGDQGECDAGESAT